MKENKPDKNLKRRSGRQCGKCNFYLLEKWEKVSYPLQLALLAHLGCKEPDH